MNSVGQHALLYSLLLFLQAAAGLQARSASSPTEATESKPDLVLTGSVTGAQNRTYFEVPFAVPAGVHRISVDFSYTGKEQRAALDLGVADPMRFRGSSGGNKDHFTIAEADATPSYLAGSIPPGKWRLLISVPNMRPDSVSQYRAEIRFNSVLEDASFTLHPLAVELRWYRGDLHMHTAHSDGSCASQSGLDAPCPLFLTAQTAAQRQLDVIAITDHNTDSHYNEMREIQPHFDRLLLVPGREITTFHGHFNIFGITQFLDWRVTPGGLDLNTVLREVRAKGGIASVNHAEAPEGEDCMGCRWDPAPGIDMNLFKAVEVINGGEIYFSSAKYWDRELAAGHRLSAVGGSDSHDGVAPPMPHDSVGWPTTVVQATELSVPAILNGIAAGRTFIDLTASHDKILDFAAECNRVKASMGGTLRIAPGSPIQLEIHAVAVRGSQTHILLDGEENPSYSPLMVKKDDDTISTTLTAGPGRHWIRIELRTLSGELQLLSSPIYVNFPE